MDYYEELGLDRTATEEDVRRAHRRLTKLLHPDQQTDEAVKQLAETQMRRLNSMVETLSDPVKRQDYDEELRRGLSGFPTGRFQRRAFHSWPWWVASTVGAVVLTVGAVWFSADKWGSSFGDRTPTYIPSGAETNADPNRPSTLAEAPPSPAPVRTPAGAPPVKGAGDSDNAPTAPAPSRTIASVPTPSAEIGRTDRTVAAVPHKPEDRSKRTVTVAEVPRRKTLSLPLTHISASLKPSPVNVPAAPAVSTVGPLHVEPVSLPSSNLPSPPKLAEPAVSKASYTKENATAKSRDTLEGEWVYAPTEPEKRKAGFYPPEYIDLRIWNDGGLRGEYRARYHITDKPISPDVSFALASDGNPRHFTWQSSTGSKGTLNVSSMDAASMRIEWRTTVFTRGLALTAGTATLVRRTP